jgi:hypothetical protein
MLFWHFLGFIGIVFYRKSHGSGLWITRPWLALGPWWTCEHGAARPLRGARGHHDSLEREKERMRSSGLSPMYPLAT